MRTALRRGIAIGAAILLATSGLAGAPALAVPPTSATPSIVILDASGSMVRDAVGGGSRMDQAKTAATTVFTALPPGAQVGLLVFGTGTGNDESERAAGCSDVRTLAELGPVDAAALTGHVAGIAPSGFTPIGPSLRRAVEMLPAGQPANIVLVTDGVDTCSPPPACEVASELRAANPALAIHVIGFAVDGDEAAQSQLQCIGRVGGGSFVTAADTTQLAARLVAAVQADASSERLNVLGAGGISLGMTLDQARRSLPNARIVARETVDGVEIIWVDCDWGRVEVRAGTVVGIAPKRADATPEGVVVGGTLDDAVRIYGDAVSTGEDALGAFRVYAQQPGAAPGYRLYADAQGTVQRIVLCLCAPVAVDIADLGSWEVSFDGVGPLRLGDTVADVQRVFPDAVPPVLDKDYPQTWELLEPRLLTVVLSTDGEVLEIGVGADWGDTPQGPPGSLPHAKGIRVGDSGSTAMYAFPGMTLVTAYIDPVERWVITDREGRALSFLTAKPEGERWGHGRGTIIGFRVSDATAWSSWYYDD